MKVNRRIITYCMLLLIGVCTLSAQTKEDKKQQQIREREILKELIDAGNYKIDASMAYPRRGRSVPLTSPYSLEIKNDSVFSHLPYYGRAYSIPYGGGQGLVFSAPVTEYKVTYNKKGEAKINITARTNEDQYKYTITVFPNGSSSINVSMQNRESISFSGQLEMKR